jgi:hypothetical protein
VLGAFGCGAFRNPTPSVAGLFRDILQEPEFASAFDEIVFAILDNQVNSWVKSKNYSAFAAAFPAASGGSIPFMATGTDAPALAEEDEIC